jgi:hypothetical protein
MKNTYFFQCPPPEDLLGILHGSPKTDSGEPFSLEPLLDQERLERISMDELNLEIDVPQKRYQKSQKNIKPYFAISTNSCERHIPAKK